ncbi:hypothetical protein M422DRAFT_268973 [Sphaerobolus stellatus SS14]|uniref:MULE transposase domain-containing protein n=1 Tax=Sphaerobolus stellatus (strain SS14) TaxID=990650 RepID=A0A0C9UWT3_SPHS4|nr:hypothetical protein M422DRAFT_268973 [Sphaerobolus stellatus SS14]
MSTPVLLETEQQPIGCVCKSKSCGSQIQPLDNFGILPRGPRKGQISESCRKCLENDAKRKRVKREEARNEKQEAEWPKMELRAFFERVQAAKESDIDLRAIIETGDIVLLDLSSKERAEGISLMIDEVMKVHWTFRAQHSRQEHTEYVFTCAQDIEREKRDNAWAKKQSKSSGRTRDSRRMERGNCEGALRLFIVDGASQIRVHVRHVDTHSAYEDIRLPDEWKKFILDNLNMTPGKLWQAILGNEGLKKVGDVAVPFHQKSVYYYWHQQVQDKWRLSDDPFMSACQYLQTQGESAYVQEMADWAPHTQELALDSTWNTNKQNFELFAVVADSPHGIGVPLAYLFVSTSKHAAKGAKEAVITSWLSGLKKWGINPEFVLTDKDQSEINAVKNVWPEAKHQLCFWHALPQPITLSPKKVTQQEDEESEGSDVDSFWKQHVEKQIHPSTAHMEGREALLEAHEARDFDLKEESENEDDSIILDEVTEMLNKVNNAEIKEDDD